MKNIEFLKENGVDIDKCLELFEDIATYNEALKGFNKSIDTKISQMESYLKDEDMPNYAIFVHSLKSDCKYFGFMKLANTAFEHEMASKENNISYVKEHYQELIEEASEVKNLVKEYLEDNPSNSTIIDEVNITTLNNDLNSTIDEVININDNATPQQETIEIVKIEEGSEEIESIETTALSEPDAINEDIILVADDSEVVRIFVKKIFDSEYEIAHASNGIEALEIIQEHEKDNKIKAILLDLNMPKKDGFAVLDYMTEKDLFDKMPVTIISGDSSKEAISKAFTYEIVDMLNKPFSEQKIKEAVEKTMNYHK